VVNCTPRTDWVSYTVQVGDSLSLLAGRVNSSVNELVSANCLANPNALGVGQVLRLPRSPSTTTGNNTTSSSNSTTGNSGSNTTSGNTTTSGGNTTTGNTTTSTGQALPVFPSALSAKPVINVSGVGLVSLQTTIALDAGIVDDAYQVDFYAGLSANDSAPVKIGADSDPFDGTQITYDFNAFDETLYFWAIATNENGSSKSSVLAVTYDPDYNPNAGATQSAVSVSPYLGFDGSVYTLQFGGTVTLTWPTAPTNASRVDFFLTPTGGSPFSIGSDTAPSNGASLSWQVPEWVLGQLSAQATFGNGTTSQSLALFIYSEGTGARPSD
jgi:hypothetical protein